MIFVREASAAVVLVTLTLSLQCVGMAALIGWARTSLTRDIHKLGPLRSAVFMVRFTTFIIGLHVLQILLWTALSLALLPIMGICLLLLDLQLCDRWLRRCRSSVDVAGLGSGGKYHRRADVRVVRERPVCDGDPARRVRRTGLT
jgi:hypothetical protein